MQTHKPPYRFVYPGRVYRNETTDAHHERAFFQYEALIVDKDITFTSGKVMIKSILSKVFGRDVPVRMRSGFFPFLEPGFEIDMQCQVCGGKGCSVCKHVGWIEVMPGGSGLYAGHHVPRFLHPAKALSGTPAANPMDWEYLPPKAQFFRPV